ncbi:MAG TPA: M36 family metallopeptidase, partial [Kofleriaceae bacterium]|nr:M36 family metallopeptidase [Kofleriaceae bacterium]
VIGSEAWPHVRVALPRTRLGNGVLRERATRTLRARLNLPDAPVTEPGDAVIISSKGYRVAVPLEIDGGADGKHRAYIDPATADVIRTELLTTYTSGTVLYRGVDRNPLRGRVDKPAPFAKVIVDGVEQLTGANGNVTWDSSGPATITTTVKGAQVEVTDTSSPAVEAKAQLTVQPNGQVVWDASANAQADAQVVTFLAVNTAANYVRTMLDPTLEELAVPMKANVNIPKSCNAFWDGKSINFFQASMNCQNTGLLEDVIYHEYGHFVHGAEVIEGVGAFDGAMGEGAADFLAASITNDSGMGRGFFYSDEPLRQLDPEGDEYRWPDDVTEIHGTGRIFGGAFWDLRVALVAQLGAAQGVALVNKLFLAALRRSTSIPSSFVEVLAADDDDGNLDNGTPHECAIRTAFGRHGLRLVTGTVDAPGAVVSTDASTRIRFNLGGLSSRCTSDAIARVLLIWVPSNTTRKPVAGTADMTQVAPGIYEAQLPLPSQDVIYYSARVMFADGSTLPLADNPADRFYTLYQGETVPLYCTSFDDDPFADGWTTGTSNGSASPWAWDGEVLKQNGYPKEISTYAKLPTIEVGNYSDVHLQYRRRLAVEDSQFDKARVTVDGAQAWLNGTANRGDASVFHHIDREWRFQDVRVSGFSRRDKIDIAFELAADPGLEFDGWAIDDLCVVANPNSICGDGQVSPAEECDRGDANGNRPNACRTWCAAPRCGDDIVDDKEACDDGPKGSSECTAKCESLVEEAGCCSANGASSAPLALLLLVFLRRRRPCVR